jgi:hypothetical protein
VQGALLGPRQDARLVVTDLPAALLQGDADLPGDFQKWLVHARDST